MIEDDLLYRQRKILEVPEILQTPSFIESVRLEHQAFVKNIKRLFPTEEKIEADAKERKYFGPHRRSVPVQLIGVADGLIR